MYFKMEGRVKEIIGHIYRIIRELMREEEGIIQLILSSVIGSYLRGKFEELIGQGYTVEEALNVLKQLVKELIGDALFQLFDSICKAESYHIVVREFLREDDGVEASY